MPWTSPVASGVGSTISLGGGSFSMATYGEAPRTSLALCATALVASRAPPGALYLQKRREWPIATTTL